MAFSLLSTECPHRHRMCGRGFDRLPGLGCVVWGQQWPCPTGPGPQVCRRGLLLSECPKAWVSLSLGSQAPPCSAPEGSDSSAELRVPAAGERLLSARSFDVLYVNRKHRSLCCYLAPAAPGRSFFFRHSTSTMEAAACILSSLLQESVSCGEDSALLSVASLIWAWSTSSAIY